MTETPVRFEMESTVNGTEFEVTGEGVADPGEGSCSVEVEFSDVPAGFDPISCPLICHQQTSLSGARSEDADADVVGLADGSYAVSPARTGKVYDQSGDLVLDLEVHGEVTREDGTIVSRQVMEGTSDLPELERVVTPVEDYVLPAGPGSATIVTRYQLETTEGELLDAITTVPLTWDSDESLSSPVVREVEVDASWDGESVSQVDYSIEMSSLDHDAGIEAAVPRQSIAPSDD